MWLGEKKPLKKPLRPTLKKYGVTEDQVNRYLRLKSETKKFHDDDDVLWLKHSIVWAFIIGAWNVDFFDDQSFVKAVLSFISASVFGAIIPSRITSLIQFKYEEKQRRELDKRIMGDMDRGPVVSYVNDFNEYQSELLRYENYKSRK